jgi:RNA ligase
MILVNKKDKMKFNIDPKYIEQGLVTERAHPTEPYLIYNYTPACAYAKLWDETTVQCRGLIVHKDTREIVARPFPKFFNYEEYIANGWPLPEGKPRVFDKRDGSLGILYFGVTGKMYIATRGSFTSDQALWACQWLKKHEDHICFEPKYTYLFEIIYPENRIVLDYGAYQGLDLLAIIETETGNEIPVLGVVTPLGNPVQNEPYASFEELKARNEKNKEGYVLRYPNGTRIKIKFEDYVKLHKVLTGLSEIGVWEMLRDGKTLINIIGDTPDEMHGWLSEVVGRLETAYKVIEDEALADFEKVKHLENRKDFALEAVKSKHAGILFAMLDGKNYSPSIWKSIRPFGPSTFRKDIDA